MYSLKWAVDYRALKTGVKGELLPARARDVCANCGTGLRGGLDEDIFEQDAVALRTALDKKKFYYCSVCAQLPEGKRKTVQTMRNLAKAAGLSVMGELMEPPKLLKLAELSGFKDHASLVDVAKTGGNYEKSLKETLDSGKMALLIYDIDPDTGGPGSNKGTKAHWCTIFGYYTVANKPHVLAVHGWGKFYDWELSDLLTCLEQMKVHPGWDLRVSTVKTPYLMLDFEADDAPGDKPSFKRDKPVPPLAPGTKSVNVAGTDYANWNKQFVAFG